MEELKQAIEMQDVQTVVTHMIDMGKIDNFKTLNQLLRRLMLRGHLTKEQCENLIVHFSKRVAK
ncbi:MAG: hypothetical protein JXB38_01380 [Anaerolineales bacterium]|nr:hypothetical protein [Anaerolineales bacterium]